MNTDKAYKRFLDTYELNDSNVSRKIFAEYRDAHFEHDGDCTGKNYTCQKCLQEEILEGGEG